MSDTRPAYSSAFQADGIRKIAPVLPGEAITPEWAWGGSTGRGVKVAVIDSGVETSHPAIGHVEGYVEVIEGPTGFEFKREPHEDTYGHGTACAGIIRGLAPECELYSVKVIGIRGGRGAIFAAGLRWAIENGMQVCNMSLCTTKKEFFGPLHELADLAYFRNVMLATAANNMPIPGYPSMYASVFSVASHEVKDPYRFYYNPEPPVEFGAPGIDVTVPWLGGGSMTMTGNSFATPHIAGVIARILGKHPDLNVFQMKTVLRALAANVEPGAEARGRASA